MIKNIGSSIKAYAGSFALIARLRLWKYFVIPVLISVVTGVLLLTSAWMLSDSIGGLVSKLWVWETGSETFGVISKYLSVLLVLAIGLVLYKHIVMALSAPFMSPVSERVEAHLLGEHTHMHRDTSFMEQLMRGIRINMRNILRELIFVIPLLVLSFIPVVGIVFTLLIFVVQSYYVGFGNMDYTMERHFKYAESVAFVKQHRGTAIGNGLVFMLLLFVPIVGFIVTLPIAVVAASTATVDILKKEGVITLEASNMMTE